MTAPASVVAAVRRADAVPLILTPERLDDDDAAELVKHVDGLLLLGGPDVDPELYGEEPHESVYGVNRARDDFEIALTEAVITAGKPIFGICRGLQVLNVAFGGTLDQHIVGREGVQAHGMPGTGNHVRHGVRLEPGSRVACVTGSTVVSGSSHHHQAVARLAPDLVATGWAEDGTVEVLEHPNAWVLAVQWHPEDTAAEDPAQQALFDAFARSAETVANAR